MDEAPQNMRDAETVRRGNEAENLLSSPVLASVISEIRNDALRAIVATDIKERNVREDNYLIVRATDTIVNLLHQRVQARDLILAAVDSDEHQEDIENAN